MAKKNREKREPRPEAQETQVAPNVETQGNQAIGLTEENPKSKAKELASLGLELAGEYAKEGLEAVGDVTVEAVKVPTLVATGGLVEGVAGIGKTIKGVYQTVKNAVFSGGGGLIDLLVPKELQNAIALGFKTVRAGFNQDKNTKDKK